MRRLGCTFGQGYLFSRPLNGPAFRSQAGETADASATTVVERPDVAKKPRSRTKRVRGLAVNPSPG